jgi:molybdenum cofactor guanylyltransferase
MGSDKALLPFGTGNLLQFMLTKVRELTPTPVIVGSRIRYGGYGEAVEDRIAGCGPLGGIHTALSIARTDRSLILSVDVPLLTTSFLRWLVRVAANSDAVVTVPEVGGRLQPLCAVYRRSALSLIETEIEAGRFKAAGINSLVTTRVIAENELHAAGFTPGMFRNLNTPDEYRAALAEDQSHGLSTVEVHRR